MKKLFFTAMMFVGMTGTAQTEVSKPQTIYKGLNSLSVSISDDSVYVIQYRNSAYTQIIDIDHILFPSKADFMSFVEACQQVIEEDKTFTHQDYYLSRSLGTCYVANKAMIRSHFYLSKNQLTKIKEAL